MKVYAVIYSNYEPAEVAAQYDNPEAAERHAEVLNERDDDGWRVVPWEVASRYEPGDSP